MIRTYRELLSFLATLPKEDLDKPIRGEDGWLAIYDCLKFESYDPIRIEPVDIATHRIINYYSVFGNEEEGFEVNDLVVSCYVVIEEEAPREHILEFMEDELGIMKSAEASFDNNVEGYELVAKNGRPLGRMEKIWR